MLEVKEIYKSFGGLIAIKGLSLEITKGSIIGLIGPNGSGKSTLFNIVSGFMRADRGEVYFNGERINGLPSYEIARKGLARTFQVSKPLKQMTVLENMLLSYYPQIGENVISSLFKRRQIRAQEEKNLQKALDLMELTGIAHLANDYSSHLSGGQQKLLSLARILARDPEMILLDEPTAGVNPTLIKKFMSFIKEIRSVRGKTFFLVEHDMNFISGVCDKVYVLDSGVKIAEGTPEQIQKDEKVLQVYLGRWTKR
jgi:ABC-type branched-subunit amino acid transport system ATPase component